MKILQITVTFDGNERTFNIRRLKYTQQAHLFVLLRRALKGGNETVPDEFNDQSDFVALAEAKVEAIANSICEPDGKLIYTKDDVEEWDREDINAVFNRLNEVNNAGSKTGEIAAAKNS